MKLKTIFCGLVRNLGMVIKGDHFNELWKTLQGNDSTFVLRYLYRKSLNSSDQGTDGKAVNRPLAYYVVDIHCYKQTKVTVPIEHTELHYGSKSISLFHGASQVGKMWIFSKHETSQRLPCSKWLNYVRDFHGKNSQTKKNIYFLCCTENHKEMGNFLQIIWIK